MYALEAEPMVPELNRNLTYDRKIKVKKGMDTFTVDAPRKVNDSLGYFRPAQEIDKVRTIPESNGMTGFVIPQLARITFRVCSDSFSSNGVREFLDDTNGYFKKLKTTTNVPLFIS